MQTQEQSLTAEDVQREREEGRLQIVDVRSVNEFATGHVPGAVNIPMEQIESRLGDLDRRIPLALVCQSGQRAAICRDWLRGQGVECRVVSGGTKAWGDAGYPLVRAVNTRWSLERQVRLGAGVLMLTSVALSVLVNPWWIGLGGFVGLGLTGAGLTGLCPMAMALAKMPWNR